MRQARFGTDGRDVGVVIIFDRWRHGFSLRRPGYVGINQDSTPKPYTARDGGWV